MYGEMKVLCRLGPLSATPYSLMMGLGALLAIALTLALARNRLSAGRAVALCCVSVCAALLGGHIAYSLAFFPALEVDYGGYLFILRLHEGGSTLFGAVFAVMLVCWLFSKKWGMRAGALMDLIAPGAALALCIGRAAEVFNGQGLGQAVEDPAFQRFPFAVCTYMDEEWSEWYLAVFVFEAAAALLIFLILMTLRSKPHRDGYLSGVFLTLFCSSQIFLEQLRADDCIRFGFVRLTQLCSLAVLLIFLVKKVLPEVRAHGWKMEIIFSVLRFVFAALCIVFTEFAFEKPQFYPYLSVCIVLLALCIAVPAVLYSPAGRKPQGILIAAVSLILGGLMLYVLTLGLENEWDYLYALMAVSVSVMACEAWPREEKIEA
ncbi:MAG: prolipoprotein diacylglyceryl transferase [Clostridia bacterium]|nr:prolipoprotein diacylglyceryl transferase [Clostridia bacterium]